VVLVTDGVQSRRFSPWNSNEFRPIDVELCQRIKDKGVTLAVVNVEYVKLPGDAAYEGTVGRFHHRIRPALRSCASSAEFYFEADDPKQLRSEFKRLGERIRTVSTSLTK
jgi:transposase